MEVTFAQLVENHILTPEVTTLPVEGQNTIHHIAIYEDTPTFWENLEESTLVLLAKGQVISLAPKQLGRLAAAGCVLAHHKGEALPASVDILPVYRLPEGTTVSQAVERYYSLAQDGMKRLVEVSLDAMEKLSDNTLHHKSQDKGMIQVICDLLKCPVVFTTSDFHLQRVTVPTEYLVVNPLYTQDTFNWDDALENFRIESAEYRANLARDINGVGIAGYLYQDEYCRKQQCRIGVFPIAHPVNSYGYLFLALDEGVEALDPEMSMKLQQILVALRFEVIKSDEIAHTINRYYDFLLDELIESDQTDFRKLMQKYGLVQKDVADDYYVLVVGRKARTMNDVMFHELLTSQQFNLLYTQIVEALETNSFFIFERKDSIVLLLPKQLYSDAKKEISELGGMLRRFLDEQYEGVGVSDLIPTEQVRQGYFQALKALAISQRSPDKSPYFYSDLGILRFFFDRSNEVDLTPLLTIYRQYIQPIIDYDNSRSGELFPTLTTYISCCSSPSAACSALYIHKNTLYSRLNKISQILNISLSDSESIFNLSLGIRIHTLIEAGILASESEE